MSLKLQEKKGIPCVRIYIEESLQATSKYSV